MSDVHVLFLKSKLEDREEWHRLVDDGTLRASALTLSGSFYAVGVGTFLAVAPSGEVTPPDEQEAPTVESARRILCRDGTEPPCDTLFMLPFRGVPSALEPRPHIAFVLVQLRQGGVRAWRSLVSDLPTAEGVEDAAALTFGRAGIDAVVEIVADDLAALQERLLDVTDTDLVVSYEVLHTSASRTRGFGSYQPAPSA